MHSGALDFVSAHAHGMAGVGYAGKGDSPKIISCGQDGQLCSQNAHDLSDKTTKSLQADGVACHCLALSPLQDSFAVGDQGHFVKVWHPLDVIARDTKAPHALDSACYSSC